MSLVLNVVIIHEVVREEEDPTWSWREVGTVGIKGRVGSYGLGWCLGRGLWQPGREEEATGCLSGAKDSRGQPQELSATSRASFTGPGSGEGWTGRRQGEAPRRELSDSGDPVLLCNSPMYIRWKGVVNVTQVSAPAGESNWLWCWYWWPQPCTLLPCALQPPNPPPPQGAQHSSCNCSFIRSSCISFGLV